MEATAFRKFFALPDDGWKWRFDLADYGVRFVALDLQHIQDMATTWQTGHHFTAREGTKMTEHIARICRRSR